MQFIHCKIKWYVFLPLIGIHDKMYQAPRPLPCTMLCPCYTKEWDYLRLWTSGHFSNAKYLVHMEESYIRKHAYSQESSCENTVDLLRSNLEKKSEVETKCIFNLFNLLTSPEDILWWVKCSYNCNNYAESDIRILKDIVFKRVKAYNYCNCLSS